MAENTRLPGVLARLLSRRAERLLSAKLAEDFSRDRFHGCPLPEDIVILLGEYSRDPMFAKSPSNPIVKAGGRLLVPGVDHPLLSHDYLNERDRADPNTMANVQAMNDTAQIFSFAAVTAFDQILGYWPRDLSTEKTPDELFLLDSEGQYYIAEGATISETLCYGALVYRGEKEASEIASAFRRLGIIIPPMSKADVFKTMEARTASVTETPQAYRQKRDHHYRQLAGLPSLYQG